MGNLTISPRYVDALSSLNDIVTLHPVADLIERAMQIAMEIEHPVYDCLYLACAERTESELATADRNLVNKVSGSSLTGSSLGIVLRYVGANGFADEAIAMATAPVIRQETVAQLVRAHDRLAATR